MSHLLPTFSGAGLGLGGGTLPMYTPSGKFQGQIEPASFEVT